MVRWHELCTYGDLLVRGAERHPDRDAVVFPDQRVSYGDLDGRASDMARALAAAGVDPGDHVGIVMANCPELLDVMFGILYLGAVVVPINDRFKPRELAYVIDNADLVALVTHRDRDSRTDHVRALYEALPGLAASADPRGLRLDAAPRLRAAAVIGTSAPGFLDDDALHELAATVAPAVVEHRRRQVALRGVAMMFYTSGTTAMPKGCPLTHEATVRCAFETRDRLGWGEGDRVYDPLPMFHTAFTQPFGAILAAGGTYLTQRHFDPGEAMRLIEEEQATLMFPAFPTITQALLNHPDYRESSFTRVRQIFNVAPPNLLRAMQAAMPYTTQVTAFGMTEFAGSVVMVDPADDVDSRCDTQGPPLPSLEVEIRDPDNRPLKPGQRGEIVARGPTSFDGYYDDPVKTAETIEPDGWVHTGDLGELDERGRLLYQGRLKDMLKVGGENVAAIEIESYIANHPAVSICQVVGVPNAKYLEVPAAFVELKPGATATADELIDFCRQGLAGFKVPRHVRFVEEWPMSATKVQKFRLRDELAAELESMETAGVAR
ncbi:MAG: class I adenylate-forming enzyme family protein [Acidimicrobiales bacterium]